MRSAVKILFLSFITLICFKSYAQNNQELIEYLSPDNKFKIMLPEQPSKDTMPTQTDWGDVELIILGVEGPAYYLGIMYADYPEDKIAEVEDPKTILANAQAGGLQSINGKVTSNNEVEINGHPGLIFTGKGSKGNTSYTLQAAYYLVDNRLYQILMLTRAGDEEYELADEIFGSFELLN